MTLLFCRTWVHSVQMIYGERFWRSFGAFTIVELYRPTTRTYFQYYWRAVLHPAIIDSGKTR